MNEERATYETASTGKPMKAVRLENFRDDDWQGPLGHRIFPRYPGARIVLRRPLVVVVELRTSSPWTKEDENFFAAMWREGFFQRWEPLSELPAKPRKNTTVYEDIGYRVGSGERLTVAQQEALLSQLHSLEERALTAEQQLKDWQARAERAEEHAARTAETYNGLVEMLESELQLKVYGDGLPHDGWMAEDATTGKILVRGATLVDLYRAVLKLRQEEHP